MVANINIRIAEYLATNYSLFDMAIVIIVIASFLILGLFYFSESKKKIAQPVSISSIEEKEPASDLILSPQITIVFQKDLADDEELTKEIADMYISNRAYYYAGKEPPKSRNQILPEKYDDVFIKYESVDFSTLNKVDI